MDGDAMQKSFDDMLKGEGPKKDFEITNEEATKFKTAMADPEFQSMLRDYMEEMQDPAARAEQETYISELEGQDRVPEGKEVVHPIAGFVLKTKFRRGSKDQDSEKLFVNVVTSDKIACPYSKPSPNRQGGESWSLPVAVGPLRMEKDKGGGSTTTFDVCYHPEALVRARRIDAFRNLVALSSLERVEDAFLRSTQQKMTAEKSYRLLKGVSYKSGPCATMIVAKADINRSAAGGDSDEKPTTPVAEKKSTTGNPTEGRKCKADRPSSVAAKCDSAGAESRAVAAEPKAVGAAAAVGSGDGHRANKTGDATPASPDSVATPPLTEGLLAPEQKRGSGGATYKLVESGAFDLADHTSDRLRKTSLPQKLIATVELPAGAEPTRRLDVVVALKRLTIGVLGDPESASPRYLDLALPYEVEDDSKCSAARDKAGRLRITMPVKPPPPLSPPPSMTPSMEPSRTTSKALPPSPPVSPPVAGVAPVVEVVEACGAGLADGAKGGEETLTDVEYKLVEEKAVEEKAEEKEPSPPSTAQQKPDHSRWVKEAEPSEVLDKPWEAAAMDTARNVENAALDTLPEEGEGAGDTAADANAEDCADAIVPPPVPPRDTPDSSDASVMEEDIEGFFKRKVEEDALFIPCSKFRKRIEGYDFKKDFMNCGYYRNDRDDKVPRIEWNETQKTMCGVIAVANVVHASVRYVFNGNKMSLSFKANVPAGGGGGDGGGGGESTEPYRTELVLAGGVDVAKCSHDTAEDNLVVKIVKLPQNEWGVAPTPTMVTKLATAINDVVNGQDLRQDGGEAVGAGGPSRKADGELLAPGHGGLGSSGFGKGELPDDIQLMEKIAYELD